MAMRLMGRWEMKGAAYLSRPASVSTWPPRVSRGSARSAEEASLSAAGARPAFVSSHLQRPERDEKNIDCTLQKIRDAHPSVIYCISSLLCCFNCDRTGSYRGHWLYTKLKDNRLKTRAFKKNDSYSIWIINISINQI